MKKWFVIMQEEEIMKFKSVYERVVYESIKSYCANGKSTAALSIRDIARRATVSFMTANRWIPRLCDKKFIQIVGYQMRVGGQVPIYKVYHVETPSVSRRDTSTEESVTPREESVTPREESVTPVGTKPLQSKKEKGSAVAFLLKHLPGKIKVENNEVYRLKGSAWVKINNPFAYMESFQSPQAPHMLGSVKDMTNEEILAHLAGKKLGIDEGINADILYEALDRGIYHD